MAQETQLERYKKLLSFIDENFKEDIDIKKIEAVSHYSYRNINRIFQALHQETIGKYVKRLRVEKGAQLLKYSEMPISDIAFEIGFEDRASFNKAFNNKYNCSPTAFRDSNNSMMDMIQQSIQPSENANRESLQYEVEYLPDFDYLFLEYRGAYDDVSSMNKMWKQLEHYIVKKDLLTFDSIFMTEIIDDNDISDSIHCRYNLAFLLKQPLPFEAEGLFRVKHHKRQKYVKFVYKGSFEHHADFYNKIYAYWMSDIGLELVDLPILEFYPRYDLDVYSEDFITEIYIAVQ